MKVMVTGAKGMLGAKIIAVIKRETKWEIVEVSRNVIRENGHTADCDTETVGGWKNLVAQRGNPPHIIINAAAMTNVDKCETEREKAWWTNVQLVDILNSLCISTKSKLIQISTDYIFDGQQMPYKEESMPNPINYYGRTKLAAENICNGGRANATILRTMWLYGAATHNRINFVDWVLSQLDSQNPFNVVTDEIGNPTLTDDLAYAILKIIEQDIKGTFNIAGPNRMSRLDFARMIAVSHMKDETLIQPTTQATLNRKAKRPVESGLLTLKATALLGLVGTPTDNGLALYRTQGKRTK